MGVPFQSKSQKAISYQLISFLISYPHATNVGKLDPTRTRKILLNRREIRKLTGKIRERGYTLIPFSIYFKNGKAKVELALAKGKRLYDKRETMKRRTQEREIRKHYKIR